MHCRRRPCYHGMAIWTKNGTFAFESFYLCNFDSVFEAVVVVLENWCWGSFDYAVESFAVAVSLENWR